MQRQLRLLLSLLTVLALGVALGACGDDDDTTTEPSEVTDDGASDEGEDGGEEASEPLCAEGATTVFPSEGEPSADAQPVTITATEADEAGTIVYAFSENATTDLASVGEYAVTFENQGAEMHEMAVVRINDDETRPVGEILQSGDAPETFSTDVAFGSACPGESSVIPVTIETPGRYVLACLFPVGSTPGITEAEFPEGPLHAAQGMLNEVTVS